MKILNKYLLKEIVSNVLMVMLALIAMFSFFDLIQELDALGKGSYGLGKFIIRITQRTRPCLRCDACSSASRLHVQLGAARALF